MSIALGLWSFLFFLEVCVAHLAYLAVSTKTTPWRKRFGLLLALVLGSVSFAPWFNVLLGGVGIVATDTGWTSSPLPPVLYFGKWVFNIGSVFFDLDYLTVAFLPVALIFICLGAWCTYTLLRRSESRVWSFVVFLGGISAGALVGPDVLLHQSRAGQSRYLTPLWLALELATAYVLARNWSAVGRAGVAWRTATVSLFVAGIASCGTSSFARTWWLANNEKTLPAIGDALSMQARPTLVYVDDDDMLLELLPVVRSPLQFSLHRRIDAPALASAIQPFAIAKPFEIEGTKARTAPHLITLRPSFPPSQDRAIQVLRRQAASVRKIGSAYEDAQLYAL